MWDHVTLRATDLDASARSTTSCCARSASSGPRPRTGSSSGNSSRSHPRTTRSPRHANEPEGRAHFASRGSFSVVDDDRRTENLHMAFPAADRAAVEAFHRDAVGAGYHDNGAPGERPENHPGYYGAFVLDPDGNNIERVFHDRR